MAPRSVTCRQAGECHLAEQWWGHEGRWCIQQGRCWLPAAMSATLTAPSVQIGATIGEMTAPTVVLR